MFLEGLPNEENFNQNDTFFLSRNSNFSNLADPDFFSTFGDKSLVMKQLNDLDKQTEEDNKSNFTFDLDIEKQVDSLLYDDDDLNDAKYLENDKSNWSSTSNLLSSNKNQHNLTTPIPLGNNILQNQIFPTESEDKFSNINTNITSTNTTVELNKKILGEKKEKNKNDENKELNISILGDKLQDTFTGDSNNKNNNTGNIITICNNALGQGNKGKFGDNFINITHSNTSSFDFHSNSVELNNANLMKGVYYCQTPNNSIYYNQNYLKNNGRYNKFQQNYSQSQYIQDYYTKGTILNNDYFNKTKTFSNMNNINFSELSPRNSIQSLNINNKRFMYNNFNKMGNNYINNMKIKLREDSNRSYKDNFKFMLTDQKGSKYIQKKIDEKSPEFLFKLYEQIKNNLFEIMTNQYGNYVIQKFVQNCDKKLISNMLKSLSTSGTGGKILYEISINNYGTRPLQKMIENLSNNMTQQDINILLNFTKGNALNLIKDINGNRIIQCIIQNIKNKELLSPLYKEINENIIEIIKTKSGCCVFSKIILNIIEDDLNNMTDIIINNIENLINDEFGNISLKRIIKLNNENYNNKIFEYIKDNLIPLSCQKFSSNVIEASIDNSTSLKEKVVNKLFENESNITNLIFDQYGNYIIQNALQNAEKNQFDIIIRLIKENEKKLKQTSHGKIIFEKLMKNYKRFLVENNNNKQDVNNNNFIKNKKQDYFNNNGKKNKNKYNGNKKNKK